MTEKEVNEKINTYCEETKCSFCSKERKTSKYVCKYFLGKQIERENMSLFERNLEMLKLLEHGKKLIFKGKLINNKITKYISTTLSLFELYEYELEIYNEPKPVRYYLKEEDSGDFNFVNEKGLYLVKNIDLSTLKQDENDKTKWYVEVME